jgi:hypothetical protein
MHVKKKGYATWIVNKLFIPNKFIVNNLEASC